GFGRIERVKEALETLRRQPWPRISHGHDDHAVRNILGGADQQIAQPVADVGHCFDSVHNQVEYDLLHLDSIASSKRQSVCQFCLKRDAVAQQLAPYHLDDLEDRLVDIQLSLPCWHLFDEVAYPANDVAGSITVPDDGIEGLSDLLQIGGVAAKEAQS